MSAVSGSAIAIAGYAEDAVQLAARYDSLSVEACYAPVLHLIPSTSRRVIDIGAGTGRDAIWLANMGHRVTAVEPAFGLPDATRTRDERVIWLVDALPHLAQIVQRGDRYDFINLAGVWHHLDPEERAIAVPVLRRIAAPGAMLMLSLRHGPAPASRPAFAINADAAMRRFEETGFSLVFRTTTDSIQIENRAANVHWTWLALKFSAESQNAQ